MTGRAAITGARGLLGANLVLHFLDRGWRVIAFSQSQPPPVAGVEFVTGDLRNRAWAGEAIACAQPDCVIHCAAATDVDWCEHHAEEARAVNVIPVAAVAAAARRVAARFVYISTDAVFDGERGQYRELDTPAPVNVYARTKMEGELAALENHPAALVARTNIYGWNLKPKFSLAEWVLHRLESGHTVPAFGDVVFSPILANDLGEAILELLDRGAQGVYHVAAGDCCSKHDFALALAEVFHLPRALVCRSAMSASHLTAPRPRNTSLDTGKASSALGRPMPGVAEGIARFKALRDNGFAGRLKGLDGERDHVNVAHW
jgi:dTDP-4-dehydrorhamnose reductase